MVNRQSSFDKFLQFFSSLKCGLTLLGLLGVAVILGTVILQRPMAREGQIEQIYAPQTIRLLDFFGFFDVFHAWWFILLLGLLGATIALASLERFPQAWRYFSRPHVLADEWFVRNLPIVREIPLRSQKAQEALPAAAREFQRQGFRARRESLGKGTLYVEKHRVARLAPYVVHLSLLIIFAGAIVDAVWGYRGFISLGPGMRSRQLEPLSADAAPQRLPFTLRCDGAGMEKYPDGSPRQYWSQLAVEENGREVLTKRIFVNEPLTYKGIRFFQANYGSSGKPSKLKIEASWPGQDRPSETITLHPGEKVPLGESGTLVELAGFVPDFVFEGNQLATRSDEPNNPAVQLHLTQPDGKESAVWFFPKFPQMNPPNDSGINFQLRDVEMGYFTGLQVAKQPGNGLIWGGCLLLSCGLVLALYMVHIRIWGVVGKDAQGRPVLLLGGQPSKYRESFEVRFNKLADQVEETLGSMEPAIAGFERLSA
ncbi:MAG TPA: cytochrome c biogenesis protein ResB [Terriglobia bacterium]|nr:cytochrome c biogenesis protein ResB [Terriglobia bacterium]